MKKLLLIASTVLLLTGTAMADTVQVDESFEKANKWLKDSNLTLTGSPNGQRDDLAAFNQEALLFYGEAAANPKHVGAQKEMMAKRAAVVVAQRALLEYMEGFALVSQTSVKDLAAENDELRQVVSGFVKGAQVVFQEYNKQDEKAIAVIKIGLHGPKGFASSVYEKVARDPKLKEAVKADEPVFKAPPVALEESYDGLIIDATSQSFRPALINRIFSTKGELLYDPAKVSQKVLIEQGCGEYTNSVEKAKAALESRGVKKPLIVQASGATTPSDLQVTDDDAVKIFSANQKGNFLAGAKVAFVLQ